MSYEKQPIFRTQIWGTSENVEEYEVEVVFAVEIVGVALLKILGLV